MPRMAIEAVTPSVDNGRFPAKRLVGEMVEVSADLISDGHDRLAAVLLWRPADEDCLARSADAAGWQRSVGGRLSAKPHRPPPVHDPCVEGPVWKFRPRARNEACRRAAD